jgi:hypothetical protein
VGVFGKARPEIRDIWEAMLLAVSKSVGHRTGGDFSRALWAPSLRLRATRRGRCASQHLLEEPHREPSDIEGPSCGRRIASLPVACALMRRVGQGGGWLAATRLRRDRTAVLIHPLWVSKGGLLFIPIPVVAAVHRAKFVHEHVTLFLHIRDHERIIPDDEGLDLPDLAAAESEAVASACAFLEDARLDGQDISHQAIEVTDRDGLVVAVVELCDVTAPTWFDQ